MIPTSSLKYKMLNRKGTKQENWAEKRAFRFEDGIIEACGLYLSYRTVPRVICISSQIGCPYSCKICCNGGVSFKRNLSVDEMIEQVTFFLEKGYYFYNNKFDITLMGVGEPLANISNVVQFIDTALSIWPNLNKVNISTIGIASRIDLLTSCNFRNRIHLQISLHASNDPKRRYILDKNLGSIGELINSAQNFSKKMNDKICYNYVLIKGVNDTQNDAILLSRLLRGQKAYLKLSELNLIENSIFEPSEKNKGEKIRLFLKKHGIEAKLFSSIGKEKFIGCGQLSTKIAEDIARKAIYSKV